MDALVVYLLLLASFFLFEFEKGCSADLNRLGLAVMLAGLTGRSTRPVHLLGRRPDPTTEIVCCVDPTVNGLTGDVNRVSACGITQLL